MVCQDQNLFKNIENISATFPQFLLSFTTQHPQLPIKLNFNAILNHEVLSLQEDIKLKTCHKYPL
jgi:hypothetical protein